MSKVLRRSLPVIGLLVVVALVLAWTTRDHSKPRAATAAEVQRGGHATAGPAGRARPHAASGASRAGACDLFAAPNGNDSNPGTITAPVATISQLDDLLAPGQTGCLRGGSYGSTSSAFKLDNNSATVADRITLTAYPGETPTITGWIDLEAGNTTLSHLRIDGSNSFYAGPHPDGANCPLPTSQGLVIAGPNDIFEYNDYFQSVPKLRGNGLGIGWWGNANNTIVRYNRIHDVGQCEAFDHLIYLAHGDNVRIYGNWLWNDAHGRGVQLYPGPTNARIYSNVIDSAGSGFALGNEAGVANNGNEIFNNVVINSTGLPNVNGSGAGITTYWGGTPGSGNKFTNNDVFNNPDGVGNPSDVTTAGNVTTNPRLESLSTHDYTVPKDSPVIGWALWNRAARIAGTAG